MAVATTHEAFSENLNTKFLLRTSDSSCVEVDLVKVSELLRSRGQERFSILFRGPEETPLPQAMYECQHERVGEFDLFIVPINRDEDGTYYDAVVNRYAHAD